MDHSEALALQAAEKYLLGELSEDEQSAFEEHYFGCSECASDLETGTLFVQHARAVFRESPPVPEARCEPITPAVTRERSGWRSLADFFRRPLVPAWAAAPLLLVCLYQGLVQMPELKRAAEKLSSARPLAAFSLLQTVRGDEKTVFVPAGADFFALYWDITWERAHPQYRCVLTGPDGQSRFSILVPAPPPGQPVSIWVPTRGLDNARYTLTVTPAVTSASAQAPLATYEFTLKFE